MAKQTAGQRLRAWRVAEGLSQSECASRIDVSQPTWSEWEADAKIPRVDLCFRVEKLTKGAVPANVWAPAARGAA